MPTPAIDPQRRQALLAIKLATLVREHAGDTAIDRLAYAHGAALMRTGEAWVLAEDQPERALGPALAWARQQGASALHLLVEERSHAAVLARRARLFRFPVEVLAVDGRALVTVAPAAHLEPVPLDPRFAHLVDVIVEGGAEPVVEHGVLVGEVAGLEVCRAVHDADLDVVRLEVGVGAHDREAFTLMHGDVPTVEALAGVVRAVAPHRTLEAAGHPLNRIARERLLRSVAIERPESVGAALLTAASPPVVRRGVKDVVPAVASGLDQAGRALVAVFSTGVDLDLVTFAADARDRDDRVGVEAVIVVAPRDDHPVTRALMALLADPLSLVTLG